MMIILLIEIAIIAHRAVNTLRRLPPRPLVQSQQSSHLTAHPQMRDHHLYRQDFLRHRIGWALPGMPLYGRGPGAGPWTRNALCTQRSGHAQGSPTCIQIAVEGARHAKNKRATRPQWQAYESSTALPHPPKLSLACLIFPSTRDKREDGRLEECCVAASSTVIVIVVVAD